MARRVSNWIVTLQRVGRKRSSADNFAWPLTSEKRRPVGSMKGLVGAAQPEHGGLKGEKKRKKEEKKKADKIQFFQFSNLIHLITYEKKTGQCFM